MIDIKITDLRNSETTRRMYTKKTKQKLHLGISYKNYINKKQRRSWEHSEEHNTLSIEEQEIVVLDCSSEAMQTRGEWSEIFKAMKQKYYLPQSIYPLKLCFKTEERLTLSEKWKTERFHLKRACPCKRC